MSKLLENLPFALNAKELLDVISGETINVCRQVEPQDIVVEYEDEIYIRDQSGKLLLPTEVGYLGLYPGDKVNFNFTAFEIGNILILKLESLFNGNWYWDVQICPILTQRESDR